MPLIVILELRLASLVRILLQRFVLGNSQVHQFVTVISVWSVQMILIVLLTQQSQIA